MSYTWAQRYVTERIDLEKDGNLIGWITENRVDNNQGVDKGYFTRGWMGYTNQYKKVSADGAQYVYRVWWVQRDEKGYIIPDSGTDNIHYASLKEAKQALENHFSVPKENVKIIPNEWNLSSGWKLPEIFND